MADTNPLGGRAYGDQSQSWNNNLFLLGQLQNQTGVTTPTGATNVENATGNLGQAAQYESQILSGDRSTVLSAAQPELSSLLSSYDSARRAAGQLQPRGGGRSQILNELPFREAGAANELIQRVRPQAAKELTATASAQGYLGAEEQSLSQQAISTSLSFLLGKAGIQLDSARLQGEQGQALGAAIGQAIPQLLQLLTAGAGA